MTPGQNEKTTAFFHRIRSHGGVLLLLISQFPSNYRLEYWDECSNRRVLTQEGGQTCIHLSLIAYSPLS